MSDDLIELPPAERRHLRDLAEAWSTYGPALREWAGLDGGMQWKTVNGADYLTRYRQDPETGKKRFTSLGRRNPMAEWAYEDFYRRRDAAKNTVLAGRDGIAKAGRVAKAYGLSRMPAKTAEVLRALSMRLCDDDVVVFGGTSLLAYEIDAGAQAPARLVEDDRLIMLALRANLQSDRIGAAYTAATLDDAGIVERGDRTIFHTPGFPAVEIWRPEYLLDRLEDRDRIEVLQMALASAPVTGLTVARDAQPVEFRTLDVRTYAMAAHALRGEGAIWNERASCAVALAARMGLAFEPEQETVLRDPADYDDDIGSPRI